MSQPVRHFVGLDLGQAQDYTALAVLERLGVCPATRSAGPRPAYALRHLQRYQLGTSYLEVVRGVVRLLNTPPIDRGVLVVDQTGVGRPVVDMIAAQLHGRVNGLFVPVTITAGHEVTLGDQGGLRVPKKELVGVLQVLLQSRRLRVARGLPDAQILVKELENFRVKITTAGNESFEAWREGQHDDLVLATGLAAFIGERCLSAAEGRDAHDPESAELLF